MRSLDILTTQNVTIEYPLAGVLERLSAYLLDLFFIVVIALGIFLVSLIVVPSQFIRISAYVSFLSVISFYNLISEVYGNGQSWGKKIIGLKVVKINGNEMQFTDYLARWVFRLVDIYLSAGTVGMFLVTSTSRAQRLGDIAANTSVIKIRPDKSPRLHQIEKIRSLDDYTPTYNQIVQMSESQMLVIKSAIEEVKKYPNKAHKKALSELTEIVCERLRIKPPEENYEQFLQTLINDYIILTR